MWTRVLRPGDEGPFLAGHRAMASEGFRFALNHEPGMPWPAYLDRLASHRCGVDVPAGLVPATFLVAVVEGTIVGRASIRHELNDWLRHEGGHIGYGVLPRHRGRGFATEMLRQSLVIARSHGVDRVLVCCDESNRTSAAVIERCGGRLESTVTGEDGVAVRRYWID